MIPEPTIPPDDSLDDAVDRLNISQRNLTVTVVQNAVEMLPDHNHELLQWLQSLPSELLFPPVKELDRPRSAPVRPQHPEDLLEIVGDIELLVQRKHSFEQSLLHSDEVEPSMQKEPSLAKHYLPVITASPKEQPSSHFIDRIVISSNTFQI